MGYEKIDLFHVHNGLGAICKYVNKQGMLSINVSTVSYYSLQFCQETFQSCACVHCILNLSIVTDEMKKKKMLELAVHSGKGVHDMVVSGVLEIEVDKISYQALRFVKNRFDSCFLKECKQCKHNSKAILELMGKRISLQGTVQGQEQNLIQLQPCQYFSKHVKTPYYVSKDSTGYVSMSDYWPVVIACSLMCPDTECDLCHSNFNLLVASKNMSSPY